MQNIRYLKIFAYPTRMSKCHFKYSFTLFALFFTWGELMCVTALHTRKLMFIISQWVYICL